MTKINVDNARCSEKRHGPILCVVIARPPTRVAKGGNKAKAFYSSILHSVFVFISRGRRRSHLRRSAWPKTRRRHHHRRRHTRPEETAGWGRHLKRTWGGTPHHRHRHGHGHVTRSTLRHHHRRRSSARTSLERRTRRHLCRGWPADTADGTRETDRRRHRGGRGHAPTG